MKRLFSILCIVVLVLGMRAEVNWPAQLPSNLGDGRLKVVGQNCRYYYVANSTFSYVDSRFQGTAGVEDKTNRLATALVYMDADIYALCEVEPNDSALHYLTIAMNDLAGEDRYDYIRDGLPVPQSEYAIVKCGYIYRSDRVEPKGANIVGTSQTSEAYKYRMRMQGFSELSSGESFVLSMNHFKAKDSSEDKGQNTRNNNAKGLLNRLQMALAIDPDVLIMGDLNETTTEPAVSSLVAKGFEEQLERYNAHPYSYMYQGNGQLIDHALANETMAQQITGAGVFHVNTAAAKNGPVWYSDHDAVMVAMNLGDDPTQSLRGTHSTDKNAPRKVLYQGTIYILRAGQLYTLDGEAL